jgi:hypothetical protein
MWNGDAWYTELKNFTGQNTELLLIPVSVLFFENKQ